MLVAFHTIRPIFEIQTFWVKTQEVLTENRFWHETATQGHSRSFILQSLTSRQGIAYCWPYISKISEVAAEIAENCRPTTPSSFDAPPWGTPANISRNWSHWPPTFAANSLGLSSCTFLQCAPKTHLCCHRPGVRIGRSRSPKVDNYGTNQKRVYDFLLVRHCNYGPRTVSEIRRLIGFKIASLWNFAVKLSMSRGSSRKKNIWGPGSSSFGRQQWLSEITIDVPVGIKVSAQS